ncbi:LacI family DNA-binding transcriptional regulator [Serinibacter salmoneus]|uniref:LacI family transcriptional regulator n=1 Tax=Serinibacter salmoneus TaxID=556530 RepID=A0A2A9D4Q3_9MICO|nr:LacI family DNA-binding transcriptional regulator [Serinibacter salmoneus]PFG20932.1 LacI family transcriptional regulator [Serinibacter salmoneus]
MQTARVTRADVARAAGVSTAVVSYVVNGGPRPVAAETATRVREAMATLGYQPDLTARALKRGSSQTLGLILMDTLNPFFAELHQELQRAAAAHGFHLVVGESHGDAQVEQELITELIGRRVDGLLLMSSGERWRSEPVPHPGAPVTVHLDTAGALAGRHTIGPDAQTGARDAVAHLADHGATRIGLVIGPEGLATPDPRLAGWRAELAERGLTEGPIVIEEWSNAGGYRAVRDLLARGDLPEALLVASDAQAIGALRALHEAGIDLPTGCRVASFDGTHAGGYTWPALTSARQPTAAMAAAALEVITDPGRESAHRSFPVDLVIRESCGCPATPPRNA